jgi:hypothetical protein
VKRNINRILDDKNVISLAGWMSFSDRSLSIAFQFVC